MILEASCTACLCAPDDFHYIGAPIVTDLDDTVTPRAARLFASAPNPFRYSTELRFELPTAAHDPLEVYGVTGQRVATFHGIGRAGLNFVHWDGRDDNGRPANAGVYYYRLASGGRSESRKVVLAN